MKSDSFGFYLFYHFSPIPNYLSAPAKVSKISYGIKKTMVEKNPKLGKIISVHSISPAYLQRAVIVAVLSFLFFLGMMLGFYIRQNIGYFLLSTAFLLVYIFTMFGWVMMRKNVLKIYENGFSYRKFTARWSEIKSIEKKEKGSKISCEITKNNGEKTTLNETIYELNTAVNKIKLKFSQNHAAAE